MAFASLLQSCSLDAPFDDLSEGSITITTDIRGDLKKSTRAISSEEMTLLRQNCIVYIENNKGLIRKYKGLENIPEEIRLSMGSYVAEAWSGDSVSASYDKKFYRAYQKFDINSDHQSLTLKCNIANVVVSVDPTSLDVNLSDLKVTFSHSRGSLQFDESNISDAKGYFMMPNADKDLNYRIEGKMENGSAYLKTGVIQNVQRAHEYCLSLSENERPVTEGGALIQITIADIPLIEDEVEIFTAPAIRGVDFDINSQVVSTESDFSDTKVYIRGYFGLSSVVMNLSSNFTGIPSGSNILKADVISSLQAKGINVERRASKDAAPTLDGGEVNVDELYITFSKSFLDNLAKSNSEYAITFEATDERHLVNSQALRIANTIDALEVPATVAVSPVSGSDLMAVGARSATISGELLDAAATGFGVKYRKVGETTWSVAYPSAPSNKRLTKAAGQPFSVKLTGLQPGSSYEYRAFSDGYDSTQIYTFKTESEFAIPNNSFENWSSYSASTLLGTKSVVLPHSVGDKSQSYWGSGNEGSATANMIVCDKSSELVHSGTYAAKLESKSAVGVIAAGNIFVGEYVRTDGTNGVLALGRAYNGSHPAKVRVYANYRPGSNVKIKDGNESYLNGEIVAGGTDAGQIYIALSTAPVEIRTNPSDRKLFNPNDDEIIAYNQITWTSAFGPDGQLQLLDIPFIYNEKAKTKKPLYLIIVASASKYGDYFSGAVGSTIYLDDFELIYE